MESVGEIRHCGTGKWGLTVCKASECGFVGHMCVAVLLLWRV